MKFKIVESLGLPIDVYWCETRSLTQRDERSLCVREYSSNEILEKTPP
jgi:hypothetical protein